MSGGLHRENMAKTDCGIGDVRRELRLARRIVIKAGTPVLTHVDGNIALGRIGALVEQIAQLRNEGRDVVLVTSGAISTGTHRMRRSMTLSRSIQDSVGRQPPAVRQEAAAAVGQSLLMSMYENLFSKYNMSCAQVLITEDDLKDTETLAQVCDATLELLGLGLVPIVNDNDAVTSRTTSVFSSATNEVQWDNDILAARLAISLRADLLLVLTDMDALYITVPEASATDSAAQVERLPLYREGVTIARTGMHVDQLLGDGGRAEFAGRTRMSAGCMDELVGATCSAVAGGVRAAVVTTGHHPLSITRVLRGDDVGTLFVPPSMGMVSSKL